jgi:multicomponent Na+:H+ antiporter subunit F
MAVFLLLNLLAGLVRVHRGPSAADRLLAAQLLGTTGTGILMLLAALQQSTAILDAALLIALLAAVILIVFVCRVWSGAAEPVPPAEGEET